MTLTTHAVTGAAIMSLVPQHPILGICAAFASHFVIDAIPHWDYPIESASINPDIGATIKYDKAFWVDIARIGSDMFLGVALSVFVFLPFAAPFVLLLGALAGILPDPLLFLHTRFRHEPLVSLQRFHRWMHTKNHLAHAKLLGIFSQLCFLCLIIATVYVFA